MSTATEAPALEPGIYDGIPAREYHQKPGASQSRLKVLREKSPAHLQWQINHPKPPTDAQVLGAAIHDAVLLPDLFGREWKRGPEGDGRTKAVKDAKAALAAEFPGATVLKPDDFDTAIAVRNAVAAHPTARQLLIGDAEQSAFWNDPDFGLLCRGRFDLIGHRTGTLVDLKTTKDAARDPFSRDIWNFGYHAQGWFYLRGARELGLDVDKFALVAVEKEPPYGIRLYELTEAAIHDGGRELMQALETYAACMESGEWPNYPPEVELIDIPTWAAKKVDERVGEV